jgi:hypothetical protein
MSNSLHLQMAWHLVALFTFFNNLFPLSFFLELFKIVKYSTLYSQSEFLAGQFLAETWVSTKEWFWWAVCYIPFVSSWINGPAPDEIQLEAVEACPENIAWEFHLADE